MDDDKLSTIVQDCILAIGGVKRVRASLSNWEETLPNDPDSVEFACLNVNINDLDEVVSNLTVVLKTLIDEV